MASYSWFTIQTTAWRSATYGISFCRYANAEHFRSFRTKFRKQANEADNKGATRAVDALINYEAVKVRH